MKKNLLYASLFIAPISFGQSFTQANEPVVGNSALLYLCDSLTDNYSTITGSSAVWDYTNLIGYAGETRDVQILDPATTPFGSNYPTSTQAMKIQNSITNYYTSTATERVSQGFLYEEPNFGNVLAIFDIDAQTTMTYPFANGDYLSDPFSGSLSFDFNGFPQNPACTGTSYAWVDGLGTLNLPNSTSYTNVMRYKIMDTVYTEVDLFGTPLPVEFIRTQFEYYNHTVSNLPLFIHTSVKIQQQGSTEPLVEQTIVLSSILPDYMMGIDEEASNAISVFPNPSEGMITVNGLHTSASIQVADLSGKIVMTVSNVVNGQQLDLNTLENGVYTVIVSEGGVISNHAVVIK